MCNQAKQIDVVKDLKTSGVMKKIPAGCHRAVLLYLGHCARRDTTSEVYRQCWPSQADIGDGTGYDTRSVREATKDLTAWGIIARELVEKEAGPAHYLYTVAEYEVLTRIGGGDNLKREKKAPAPKQMSLFGEPEEGGYRIMSPGRGTGNGAPGGSGSRDPVGVPEMGPRGVADHVIPQREVEVKRKEGRKEKCIDKISDPSFLPKGYELPNREKAELSYQMLVDSDISLGRDLALQIASVFSPLYIFDVLVTYMEDLSAGNVRGPGVLLSRFENHSDFTPKAAEYSNNMPGSVYDFYIRYSHQVDDLYEGEYA